MATNDQSPDKRLNSRPEQKSLKSHPEQQRIEAHKEAQRIAAHSDADDVVVPAVTADIDETPKFVKYGAAVLLGLAFGVACYVWVDGGVPSAPQNPGRTLSLAGAPSYVYPTGQGADLPAPFGSGVNLEYVGMELPEAYTYANTGAKSDAGDAATVIVQPVVYLFAYDSSKVPETAELTRIARQARQQGLSLDVKAYTDEHGRAAYNQRLSERRAKAIADYLVAHGVPASQIDVHGMGPTHAYANDAQDRRAEVTVK